MKTLVLSDIHYKFAPRDRNDRQNSETILRFLTAALAEEYDLLVLNGDIFDLWFDWRYSIIKQYFPLLKRLADFSERGCRIIYISGNHDFWFNDFFSTYLNAEIYQRCYILEADGKKTLITHGDLYTNNDARYRIFRRLIRLPLMKRIFALLHPDWALTIGAHISRSSRVRTLNDPVRQQKISGLQQYAQKQLKHFDHIIMGHSHEPCLITFPEGVYANSGDWIGHYSYVKLIDGNLELGKFEP
ncbi:MAG: UDP-2,3-diacylglucosamine diphosphatase [Candidatus Cloacimonetes bacterium]|nr:UDP-2,3-diacylglucosamine diphosphatase [Candidatus Cloacimonadota bacterium]